VPVGELSRFWQDAPRLPTLWSKIDSSGAIGPRTALRPMANLISGQVEALLPSLLAAMDAEKAAKATVADLKAQMLDIIGTPQTVKTVWGSVTLKRGSRTVKVISKLLSNKISLLKEEGIATGDAIESFGDMVISVSKTDR